jgi:Uma2 family endonuclease
MNALAPPTIMAGATRLFNAAEFLRVCDHGVFGEGEHIELWDGAFIMAPSEGTRHFFVKAELNTALVRALESSLRVGPTGPVQIDDLNVVEPDLFIYRPAGDGPILPDQVLLVIEIAVTSLQRDRTEKALRYARAGIEDYWVVDADRLITWVHRKPSDEGFGEVREFAPIEAVSPLAAPSLSIRMSELFPG